MLDPMPVHHTDPPSHPTHCGGAVKIIACIEDPAVIKKILDYLDAKFEASISANQLPEPRVSPQASLF